MALPRRENATPAGTAPGHMALAPRPARWPSSNANLGPTQWRFRGRRNLTRLPFGQFFVINPDSLPKRRERPCHVSPGRDEPVKMGAMGFLTGEYGLARRHEALGLMPPVRVGRNPGQLGFMIRPQRLGGWRVRPSAVALRLDTPGSVCGSRDSAGGFPSALIKGVRDLAGISGFSAIV